MRNIMISQAGEDLGVLEWDDDVGHFKGYAADEVNACAAFQQDHPGWPPIAALPSKDGAALALLLECLGYDMPAQLAAEAQAACAGKLDVPDGTLA